MAGAKGPGRARLDSGGDGGVPAFGSVVREAANIGDTRRIPR